MSIDPDSLNPPTAEQYVAFAAKTKADYARAAKARGYESGAYIVIGSFDPSSPDTEEVKDGFPLRSEDGRLYPSDFAPGTVIQAQSDRGPWTVQRNILMDLWQRQIFANVVFLVRPLKDGPAVAPVPTDFRCDPETLLMSDLLPEKLSTGQESVTRTLFALSTDWGDWSPIPQEEFFENVRPGLFAKVSLVLHQLEQLHLIRLEKQPHGQHLIHLLPAVIDLFELPE
jgi:hypothetical protein